MKPVKCNRKGCKTMIDRPMELNRFGGVCYHHATKKYRNEGKY